VREPRRAALGLLYEVFGEGALAMTDLAPVGAFTAAERAVLGRMLARGTNAPWCSSVGRLFDAFAALCGLRQVASYEGQAASALEWAADGYGAEAGYEFPTAAAAELLVVDWQGALERALVDLRSGVAAGAVAAALLRGLAAAIVAVAERIGERRVILTGGCFQNARLTEEAVAALRGAGFEPAWHRQVPPNDGGIALGQAVWAGWCEQRGEV
jgi:hydrogenase maturation protein HypF